MGKTIVEKIFDAHLRDEPFEGTFVLNLDRVFCHEVTTPIAIADLETRKKDRVFDNTKIKAVIDHITPAKDTKSAIQGKMLRDWAHRHSIKDFFDIGENGVCHAIFPEKGFVEPGFTIIMGDSHTCTHGAFGAFACGVGTTDLEVGILKGVCAFRKPETIRVNINGKLQKHVYSKDVILTIIKELTVNGATDKIIEFHGEVVKNFSMDDRMTLSNMAIEAGGTSGLCMPDETTLEYLWEFIKDKYNNDKAAALAEFKKWHSDSDATYVRTLEIDASKIVPVCTVNYKPDDVKPISELPNSPVHQIYIGSCTNGRIDDLRIAAEITKGKKLAFGVRGIVSPATPKIFKEAMKEGLLEIFMDAGYCVTNPTCGACLGMSNGVLAPGEVAIATTNRNFNGRMGKGGMVHLASPASAAAAGITGKLTDPRSL
ncbi:MAG: 3-isopropylmalate dehydratase large subunit [Chitinivibrionia bacterium]|nr:3-isopropylmalate dehydratase large subunit [Chitinivibrionia bacterium]